jgi:hypothetical protein
MIRMLSTWKHSGFHIFCGNRISPDDDTAMENQARYIIRASFSRERMTYLNHPFLRHRHRTPYFVVVKIQLTHKIILHTLPS